MLVGVKRYLTVVLICLSLVTDDEEDFFLCFVGHL